MQRNKRGTSIDAIDAMFNVEKSLLSFFCPDMWRCASGATIIAGFMWLIPLVAIVSPTSLSVGLLTSNMINSTCRVPVLDMTQDSKKTATQKVMQNSVSPLPDIAGRFDYVKPSLNAKRIVMQTAMSGAHITWQSPCGKNCSYEQQFIAPSLQCEPSANPFTAFDGMGFKPLRGNETAYPLNITYGDFQKKYGGNAWTSAIETRYNATFDKSDGRLWVATTQTQKAFKDPAERDNTTMIDTIGLEVMSCQLMKTSYRLGVNYTNAIQTTDILNYTFLNRVNISSRLWKAGLPDVDDELTYMAGQWMDVASLFLPLLDLLNGNITYWPPNPPVVSTQLFLVPTLAKLKTDDGALFMTTDPNPYSPIPHMAPALEELSRNISISLLSDMNLGVTNLTTTTCKVQTTSLVWKYDPFPLLAPYIAAIIISVICLGAGAWALCTDGVVREQSFSTVLRTTRGATMDELTAGHENGTAPLHDDIAKTRVTFGVLTEVSGRRRRAFGTPGEVDRI